jgi:hypothetical protein
MVGGIMLDEFTGVMRCDDAIVHPSFRSWHPDSPCLRAFPDRFRGNGDPVVPVEVVSDRTVVVRADGHLRIGDERLIAFERRTDVTFRLRADACRVCPFVRDGERCGITTERAEEVEELPTLDTELRDGGREREAAMIVPLEDRTNLRIVETPMELRHTCGGGDEYHPNHTSHRIAVNEPTVHF